MAITASSPAESNRPSPLTPPVTPDATREAERFGRVDEQGNVWVRDGESERIVGSYPDGVPEDPLALYVRRFVDLETTVNLFEARLPSLAPKDIDETLKTLRTAAEQPAAVGDLPGLRARIEKLAERAEQRKQQAKAERKEAKEQALAQRTSVVERAEALAQQDPAQTHWKNSRQELGQLLEEWKGLQHRGPRLDRPREDALWKRFSSARTLFDRHRRQFFSALDQQQGQVKAVKEAIIAEAESLQSSTDWRETSGAFRELMRRWKAAGRASRKEDDALWARFRAAQQVFYDARRAADAAEDQEYQANLAAKEKLLAEAEALVPIADLEAAKRALRDVEDRWEQVGRVPSSALTRVEGRLRAVEQAVRDAEDREWKRSNPETRARGTDMAHQLEQQIAQLGAQVERAKSEGGARLADLQETLETKRAWLRQIQSSLK